MEQKIEQLERERRRNIIIVEGVPEVEGQSSPEVIEELFADLKVDFDTLVCNRLHRVGKLPPGTGEGQKPEVAINGRSDRKKPSKHRAILVSFKKFEDKIKVYRHVKNLKDLERWNRVFINDDLTECQQNQQRDLRALAAFARSKGYNSSVRSTFIVVQGKKYSYQELGRLAPEISLEKAKTLECLDWKGIAYQSDHAPLSNLYPCNIVYKSRVFLSAEGALQHTRAIICGRTVEANQIEFERNAYKVKRIASGLPYSQEWEDKVEDILLEILIIKFTTNSYCRKALMATGDRSLFEATGDKVWACGLALTRIQELTIPTPGKNQAGLALEKVRGIVKA